MKYLKTFENQSTSELKKYLLLKIIDNKNVILVICEILNADNTYLYNINKLYKIDKDGFREVNQIIKLRKDFLKRHTVKQSYNLEKLINIIEPMFHSEKFNI